MEHDVTAPPEERRGGGPLRALVTAAGVAVGIALLVVVAFALPDGPGSNIATRPPSPSAPSEARTWIVKGRVDGSAWTATARRSSGGAISVRFQRGSTVVSMDAPPDALTTLAGLGGDDPTWLVAGITPIAAASLELTLPDGITKTVDVVGDGTGMGGRLFVANVPAEVAGTVRFDVRDAAGRVIESSQLAFRGGEEDGEPSSSPPPADEPPTWRIVTTPDGTVTAEGFNEFVLTNRPAWAGDPEQSALQLLRAAAAIEGAEAASIDVSSDVADPNRVVVVVDDLPDDSVRSRRYDLMFRREGELVQFVSGTSTFRCQPGRGQQEFGTDLCL